VAYDVQEEIYYAIRGDATLVSMLAMGVDSVKLANVVSIENLNDASDYRRSIGEPQKVLLISVFFNGETKWRRTTNILKQDVGVVIYDRPIGDVYNIKRVSQQAIDVISNHTYETTQHRVLNVVYDTKVGPYPSPGMEASSMAIYFNVTLDTMEV